MDQFSIQGSPIQAKAALNATQVVLQNATGAAKKRLTFNVEVGSSVIDEKR